MEFYGFMCVRAGGLAAVLRVVDRDYCMNLMKMQKCYENRYSHNVIIRLFHS